LLTSKRARLLDDVTTRTQLCSLERKVVSGHEIVTHPSAASSHDDVAASVCGCLVAAAAAVAGQFDFDAMRRVNAKLAMMGPYRRPLIDRQQMAEARIGERRLGQLRQFRGW
jgi:hypothetical protein